MGSRSGYTFRIFPSAGITRRVESAGRDSSCYSGQKCSLFLRSEGTNVSPFTGTAPSRQPQRKRIQWNNSRDGGVALASWYHLSQTLQFASSRHRRGRRRFERRRLRSVIPAQAGIQEIGTSPPFLVPACAGISLDSCLRGNAPSAFCIRLNCYTSRRF